MRERPILFNTEMVRAILDGRKVQTRRIVKGLDGLNVYLAEPSEEAYESLDEWDFFYGGSLVGGGMFDAIQSVKAPCAVGDILWVRESWCTPYEHDKYAYRADYGEHDVIPNPVGHVHMSANMFRWRPSIHMPKQAARIFLRVTYVRAEKLQEMTELSAKLEGVRNSTFPLKKFSALWDKTISRDKLTEYGWDANPWVWVIEFERVERPASWEV